MHPDPTQPLGFGFSHSTLDLFRSRASSSPDAPALVDETGHWSYAQLDAQSSMLAARLLASGLQTGDRVALYAHRGGALVAALLSALKAGLPFCVLDPAYPEARLAALTRVLAPRALLHLQAAGPLPPGLESELASGGCAAVLPVKPYPEGPGAEPAPTLPPPTPDADDTAYLLFTSGTTGVPKGIEVPHHALPHFLGWYTQEYGLHGEDRFSMLSGLAHDPLLRDVFTPLSLGATLHIPEQELLRRPDLLSAWMREQRITVAHLTPSLCRLLCGSASSGVPLPDLRYALIGGETLYYRDVAALRAIAPQVQVVNCYGATETPQFMACYRVPHETEPTGDGEGAVPLGSGIADAQLLVVSAEGRLAAEGETGEILVRSPYLSKGYLSDPRLTEERFVRNPFRPAEDSESSSGQCRDLVYRTGDLGRYDPDGIVHYLGRADNQVKVRGFRVELEEIESALLQDGRVESAAVVCSQDSSGSARLVAGVLPKPGYCAESCRRRLESLLPDYMVPSEIVEVSQLPMTPNGKVDRRALRGLLESMPRTRDGVVEARDDTERALVEIWEDLLGVHPVGITEDFQDLGGHSLLATVLLNRIHEKLGKRLRMSTLVEANTIEKLAAAVSASQESPDLVAAVPLKPGGSLPPAFWVPGGGGLSVLAFRKVSSLIQADRPIYGLEASLEVGARQLAIPEKASLYIEAVRRLQPAGPYALMGFSAGSWLAFEMACQLARLGETLDALVVFDTEVPGFLSPLGWGRLVGQAARYHLGRLRRLPPSRWRGYLLGTAKRIYWDELRKRNAMKWDPRHTSKTAGDGSAFDIYKVADNNSRQAAYQYAGSCKRLPRYPGKVTVVLAEDAPATAGVRPELDPRLGWRHLASGGVAVYRVSGDHLSMLEHPHVESVAGVLTEILQPEQTATLEGSGRRTCAPPDPGSSGRAC